MTCVTLIRGDGDRVAPAVVDPLLTTIAAKVERGRVVIDLNSKADTVQVVVRVNIGFYRGAVVLVRDTVLNSIWYGVIKRLQFKDDAGGVPSVSLTVWRPRIEV